MSIKICMYFRDKTELERVRTFICLSRSRDAGISSSDIEQIIKDEKEIRRIDEKDKKSEKVKPVEQSAEPKHTVMDDLDAYLGRKPKEHPALPNNEDREIPHTLQRFVDEGWDLDTAFRIYDEFKTDINNAGSDVYVKSLNQRFMEERMKRDANESAE